MKPEAKITHPSSANLGPINIHVCDLNQNITVTSHGRHSVSNHRRMFVQQLVQTNKKENIKALHGWSFVRVDSPQQRADDEESVFML